MKLLQVLAAGVLLTSFASTGRARADGWSLLHPFSSTTTTPPQKPVPPPVKKEPSIGEKMGSGTKKVVGNIGNALTLKKRPEAKKTANYYGSTTRQPSPYSAPKSKPNQQSSWWNPFHKEEPKPKSLSDFVGMKRPE
jgi:hypothetical protein